MPRILAEDYTFVTNNARDFRKLYGNEDIHITRVLVVPCAELEHVITDTPGDASNTMIALETPEGRTWSSMLRQRRICD